jgi:hypothetical protein
MTEAQQDLLPKAQQSLATAKLLLTNNYPDNTENLAQFDTLTR